MKKTKKIFKKGFSFTEVIIVIAIIGVLASVVLISMQKARIKNENAATMAMAKDYEKAVQNFIQLSNGREYPDIANFGTFNIWNRFFDCLGPDDICAQNQDLDQS